MDTDAGNSEAFTLDRLLQNQVDNALMSKQALGKLWDLAPLAVRLLEDLGREFEPSAPGHLGVMRSLLFAYRAAAMALADVVHFQFVEAAAHLRRVLELCALAWHFAETPDDFTLWQDILSNDLDPRKHPRWKEYRDRFGPRAVQLYLEEMNPELNATYRLCNLQVHGTVASQVRATQVTDGPDPDMALLGVKFVDFEGGNPIPIAAEMIQVVECVRAAVEALAPRLLKEPNKPEWRARVGSITRAMGREASKWIALRVATGGTPTT